MKKLINMKLDRKAREASTAAEVKPEGPRYPWGLSLTLDNEALDKLGLALPDVGTKFTVMAQANVTGISSSE